MLAVQDLITHGSKNDLVVSSFQQPHIDFMIP